MSDQLPETAAFSWVDRETHEPCPTRPNVGGGTVLCTITDPAHRHIAAHMVPRLGLTVQAGEPWSVLDAVEALSANRTPPGQEADDA